jgi:hypothetical protein
LKAEGLVTALAGLAPTRNLGSAVQNLEPYGLANPPLQVEIEAPTGRTYRLLVGAQTPEKTGYYVSTFKTGASRPSHAQCSGTQCDGDRPNVYVIGDDFVKTQLIANLENPPRATPSPSSAPLSPSPSGSP